MPSQQLLCVFVSISPLLSALVEKAISRRVELQSVERIDAREGLPGRLEALNPGIVVVGLNPGESDEIGASLLAQVPRAKIVLISGGGDYAYVYEMRPHRGVLFDFSPDALAAAIFEPGGVSFQPFAPSSG
jgi:hypothetical protein